MDTKTNKSQTFAQKYPDKNRNETRTADYTNKIGYHERIHHQQGGLKSEFYVPTNYEWFMGSKPMGYNQNFLGVKSSHYVPPQGRYTNDLSFRNDSSPKVPDSQLLLTKSHVPRQYS